MWPLKALLKPYWKVALLAPLLMVVEVYMDLLQPRLMATIVNDGVMQGNLHRIQATGVLMVGVALIGLIGGVGCAVFSSIAALNFATDLRDALFSKVQALSFRDLDEFNTGSLVTRLTNDVVQVQTLVQMALRVLVRAPLLLVGSLIMALTISFRLGVILLVAIPILLILLIVLIRYSYPLFAAVQRRLDAVNTVLQENLAGIRVVKAFVRSGFERRRFGVANDAYTDTAVRAGRALALNMPVMMLIMNFSIVAVLWYQGHPAWSGPISVGNLIAFINYVGQVLFSLLMVSMMVINISQAKVSADRIHEVLRSESDIQSRQRADTAAVRLGRVVFDRVSFSYGRDDPVEYVLRDLSLVAEAGQTLALIGSTGSGKSTLVNLIPRLYDVTCGRVQVDGVDVRDIDLLHLRSRIGMVLQESILFTGTVRDNICFGRPDATQQAIEAVARAAQAHDFIVRLPDGYDTLVGQRGVNLSGGQKQRLCIARALLVRPAILVLDDSTSAVDLGTEARLQRALRDLMQHCTTFLIAQRISSVLDAHKIVVLEDGAKVGEGTHGDLMRTCAVYQEIYRSQLGEETVVGA